MWWCKPYHNYSWDDQTILEGSTAQGGEPESPQRSYTDTDGHSSEGQVGSSSASLRLKKTKIRKRKGLFVNNEHTGNDVDRPNPKKKRKKNNSSKPTSTIADDDDTPCGECGKRCNDPPLEDWKQYLDCQQWFHERCCPEDTDICYTCLG